MSNPFIAAQIALPAQDEEELVKLVHGSTYRAPNFLPGEILHSIIQYFGLLDQLYVLFTTFCMARRSCC